MLLVNLDLNNVNINNNNNANSNGSKTVLLKTGICIALSRE